MFSIKLNEGCCEVCAGEEATVGLVVSGGHGFELLEFDGELLDQAAQIKQVAVVIATALPVATERDPVDLSDSSERLQDVPVGGERLVGDQCVGLHLSRLDVSANQLMRFAAIGTGIDRVSQHIGEGAGLFTQPAARAAERLVLVGFFGCWRCADLPVRWRRQLWRITVGIAARCSKICCQASLLAQCEDAA